jgi:DNA helicase II / ATP-dependent DNA helicase PcrA
MTLSQEAIQRINEEEGVLERTLSSLQNAQVSENNKFSRHSKEARALTSEIVNSSRDVDKQMLSNDESISHSLSNRAKTESETIEQLLTSPYFARVVLEEAEGSRTRIIEYKLGKKTHLDSSIIDWKNAPLARLFYEYEEGEEYLEDIRGRERTGKILRKHKVKINEANLISLDCPLGFFKKNDSGSWDINSNKKTGSNGNFELPSILSFITADQFRLITEESEEPVILHGVAGSGKTSVALHRLTWQLSKEKDSYPLILTPTEVLANYIKNTLENLDVKEVEIKTITNWMTANSRSSKLTDQFSTQVRNVPPHIARVKTSLAMVKMILQTLSHSSVNTPATDIILDSLSSADEFLAFDSSNLISIEGIKEAKTFTEQNFRSKDYDWTDLPLLLLLENKRNSVKTPSKYTHLFLDEFQDVTPVELAFISSCIKKKANITITGDLAQHTKDSYVYQASLDALLVVDDTTENESSNVHALSISHRSTLPIMKYADFLLGSKRTMEGRDGKPPLLIICNNHTHAIQELSSWIERVEKNFSGETILIATSNTESARNVRSFLKPALGDGVCLLTDAPRSTDGLVLIAPITECKGLEFPHVAIWDASKRNFPDTQEDRRILYLAATRAEEHLTLILWGEKSPLLPNISSKLHRVYDVRFTEES